MTYTVLVGCSWQDPKSGKPRGWRKGDTLKDGDVPPEVVKVLLRRKAIAPNEPPPAAAGG